VLGRARSSTAAGSIGSIDAQALNGYLAHAQSLHPASGACLADRAGDVLRPWAPASGVNIGDRGYFKRARTILNRA
jgi:hypothetical protein